MTTYILHGGRTKVDSTNNELFFKQFTDSVKKNTVKILLCYFARQKNEWKVMFENDKNKILKQSNKKVEINIVYHIDVLTSQLTETDVIYFSGGEEEFLRPYFKQLDFLKNGLQNKIFIGSSMGSFLASKNYVLSLSNQNEDTVYEGLGLVPYNILCHWNIEKNKEKKIKILKEKDSLTPILLIDEQKFEKIVI